MEQAEAKWNQRLSKLRCDNGREYINKNLIDWCRKKGIQLDRTIPYTPQLNGKAERLNRTLIEKSRALIIDSGLDKEMWGEAAYASTYLLNRSPTSTLDVTPAEAWNQRKINLNNIRVFGCNAFAKVLEPQKKLNDRSRKYILVGYAPNGYRLWDSEKRKIIIARDIKFEEETKILTETPRGEGIILRQNIEDQDDENENDSSAEGEEEVLDTSTEDSDSTSEEYQDAEREEIKPMEQTTTVRKSTRERRPPKRYDDYYSYLTYTEAITGLEKKEWKRAIEEEKKSLQQNDTWKVVDKAEARDRKLLTSKWVFKEKENGQRKARLVVRGCQQKSGIDYNETFSPVISNDSLRTLFAVAATSKYKIITFDVKTAFLYGEIDEDIFMMPPEGYDYGNKVCKLKKSLYGLKQAPLKWNERFTNFLRKRRLKQLKTEQCIFKRENNTLILGIYVDDGIIIGKDMQEMNNLLDELRREFEIKVYRNPSTFLGMELCIEKGKIKLTQTQYSKRILEHYNMQDSKSVSTPLVKGPEENDSPDEEVYPYREAIGSLLYLSTKTRPDIAYATSYGSRYISNPKKSNVNDVKRMFRYVKGTINQGIQYSEGANNETIEAYCDADHAGDPKTRKSTTGYIIMYGGGPISWSSRKQSTVALSTTEAEYIAAAECSKKLLLLKSLIEELTDRAPHANLKVDNQSAICLIKNGMVNKRSRYIDVKYHYIHHVVKKKKINVEYCQTEMQYADILTKALNSHKFNFCKNGFIV